MPTLQPGVFAFGNTENGFLELDLKPEASFEQLVKTLVNVGWTTGRGVTPVFAFRPSLWRALHPDRTPADAADFDQPIGTIMPATQHDAWIWIQGGNRSAVFDALKDIHLATAGLATTGSEISGFPYHNSRDLTGFVDGTENPSLLSAPGVVTVPAGQPGEGTSVLLYQQWRHEMSWFHLSTKQQEDTIGRTKQDDVELPDDKKPLTSHVARNVIEKNGHELEIFRRNVGYGDPDNHGTLFIGFTPDQFRIAEMLRRMAGVAGDGLIDNLTRFTTALSGSFYVVPALEDLAVYEDGDDD